MTIEMGSIVKVRYRIRVSLPAGGPKTDLYDDEQEATLAVGTNMDDGSLFLALQEALVGKSAGDAFEITLPPEKAGGLLDPAKIFTVSSSDLEDAGLDVADLSVGDEVEDVYCEERGTSLDGKIAAIDGSTARIDTNARLAGLVCEYSGRILEVQGVKVPLDPAFLAQVRAYAEGPLRSTSDEYALDRELCHFSGGRFDSERGVLHLCALNPDTDEYDLAVLEAEVDVIGTQDTYGGESSVFRWSWALEGIHKNATERIERVREYGRTHDMPSLASQTCTTSDYDEVLHLLHAAAFITDAAAVYYLSADELGLDDPDGTEPTYYFALYKVQVIDRAAFETIVG